MESYEKCKRCGGEVRGPAYLHPTICMHCKAIEIREEMVEKREGILHRFLVVEHKEKSMISMLFGR